MSQNLAITRHKIWNAENEMQILPKGCSYKVSTSFGCHQLAQQVRTFSTQVLTPEPPTNKLETLQKRSGRQPCILGRPIKSCMQNKKFTG
jgi:hypothetical protein